MNSIDIHRDTAFANNPSPSAVGPVQRVEEQTPFVTQGLAMLRRRKWYVVGSIAACILLSLVVTLLMTRQYTAYALLEIQRETASFADVGGGTTETKGAFADQEFYETQYGLLRSQALAERVVENLRLYDQASFFQVFKDPRADEWFVNGAPSNRAASRAERTRVAGALLLKNFVVAPERLSRLVRVSFKSPDPDLSKRVIDAWSKNFIQITLERRFESTSYARSFLENRLQQLRDKIDQSERALVDYASREGLVTIPSSQGGGINQGSGGDRSLVVDDLASLNTELSQAVADRVRAESRLAGGANATEVLSNSTISALRQRRANLAADYAKLLVQFEPNYPPATALKTQITQMDQSITREEARVSGTLQETYRAARAREAGLTARVNELKSGVLEQRRRSIQYNIFQRDADTNRQLYDALLQRYKAIGVAGGVGVNNIAIVDPAETPQYPSSPKLLLNLALGIVAGTMIGLGLMLIVEQMDQGVSDPVQVERQLGIPMLGTVPKAEKGDALAALQDRKSAVSEAYQSVRTNLAFSTNHGVPHTLGITSSRPAEGKTTTSLALAQLLARSGKRVLLIDGDMRSPSIHHLLGLSNKVGLSNFLAGDDLTTDLIQVAEASTLSVMAAGPHPPSAADLLLGDRVSALIEQLQGEFEHIIIDSPPVMGLADAPLLASRLEAIVFVVEFNSTQRDTARTALQRLGAAHANLLGVVLTKFDPRRAQGYSYNYGYSYGDGDGDG